MPPSSPSLPTPSGALATSARLPRPHRHELSLHRAQGEILDQELEIRKLLWRETERILSLFDRVCPLFAHQSPALATYAAQIRRVRQQLEEMRARERAAAPHPDLPLPDTNSPEDALLLANLRKVAANHAYFPLFTLHQVLLSNIQRLLQKLSQSDPSLAAPLAPVVAGLTQSWQKIAPLGGVLSVRRVVFAEGPPSPEYVKDAWTTWNELLRLNPENKYLQALKPHGSQPGRTRIVYFAIGGLGDALLQTPCVAELKRRFDPCEILFIHSRPVVHPLFDRNPTVAATVFAEDRLILKLPDVVKVLGIFDVVFESRFVIWGELCHQSRITAETDVRWIAATHDAVAAYAPYLERFPQYCNLFARIVRPRMLLDVHGKSTGLPVSVDSPLLICPAEADADYPERLGLADGTYITVHDGFDDSFGRQMRITRCTKQLPAETWRSLIAGVRWKGLRVVQVGTANEPAIPGVDLDLRGATSLSQLCFVLKGAAVHVDTEGGIVHVARAVHKRSIVFFGPTSVTFWGYPQNINLCSKEYADHWWINFDWMVRSPIEQKKSAMEAFEVANLPDLVVQEQEAAAACAYRLDACTWRPAAPAADGARADPAWGAEAMALAAARLREGSGDAQVALVGAGFNEFPEAHVRQPHVEIFDGGEEGSPAVVPGHGGEVRRVLTGSLYNLPANSGRYEVVVCLAGFATARFKQRLLKELLRLLQPGGTLVCAVRTGPKEEGPTGTMTALEIRQLLGDVCGTGDRLAAAADSAPDPVVPETPPHLPACGVFALTRVR